MHPVAPPSPDYVPGPEHPPSPVYVPEPEYPEYLVPSGDEAPIEDQPLSADALPTALSSGYVADSDPDEDPEVDPEEDHADYPVDRWDGDDETSDDDDDDDDKDEEASEDEEEEEHLALANSSVVPVVNPVPSVGDTKAFETNESAPTPRSPQTKGTIWYRAAGIRIRALLSCTSHRTNIPEAEMSPRKRACFTTPAPGVEVGESSAAGAVR
ncbi:hypothetical protein Tco_1256202 [Tanacetum coccineum]